jgi:hypothetical protein
VIRFANEATSRQDTDGRVGVPGDRGGLSEAWAVMKTAGGPEQRAPLFSLVNLLLLSVCVGVFAASVSTGAGTGSVGGLIAGVVAGIVLAPVVFVVGFSAVGLVVMLLVLMFSDEIPVSGWLARTRIVLRGTVIVGAAAWVVAALLWLQHAKTTRERNEAILLGLLLLLSTLFLLVPPRLERRSRKREVTADPHVGNQRVGKS